MKKIKTLYKLDPVTSYDYDYDYGFGSGYIYVDGYGGFK